MARSAGLDTTKVGPPSATRGDTANAPPAGHNRLIRPRNEIVLDLTEIRTRIGPHWADYGPSVHRIARRVLTNEMQGRGSFVQHDDAYVLRFDRLHPRRARSEVDRILQRLTDLLFRGKGIDAMARVDGRGARRARASRGRRRSLFGRLISFWRQPHFLPFLGPARHRPETPPGATADAADTAPGPSGQAVSEPPAPRPEEDAAAPPAPPARSGPAPPPASPRPARPAAGGRATAAPPGRPAGNSGVAESGDGRPVTRRVVSRLREARAIEDAMALVVLRRNRAWFEETQTAFFPPPDLDFIYRPMWSCESGRLTTYCCVPIARRTSMTVSYGDDVVPRSRRPSDLQTMDRLSLERAAGDLRGAREGGPRVLLLASVHAATLMDGNAFAAYLDVAQSMPEGAPRHLVLEIVDMADLGHTVEAIQVLSRLQSTCRTTIASVRLNDRSFDFWKACRLTGVGIDLARVPKTETSLMLELDHFASEAKRHKILSYVRGLEKMSLTMAALGAGFDFLEGTAIGSVETLDDVNMQSFGLLDLCQRRLDPDGPPGDRAYLDVTANAP